MSPRESSDWSINKPEWVEISFNAHVLFKLTPNWKKVFEEYCSRVHSTTPEKIFEIDWAGYVKMPFYQVVAIFSKNITTFYGQDTAISEFKIIIPTKQPDSSQGPRFVWGRDAVMEILANWWDQEHYQMT